MSIPHIAPGTREKRLTGKHVLAMFLAFFGVVFLVNGLFMYVAVSTHSGVDSSNAYRRGLDYNWRIKAGEKQAELRWKAALALSTEADKLTLGLTDRSGFPVPGLIVTGLFARPAIAAFDQNLTFVETAPGIYSAAIAPPKPGNWIATINAAGIVADRHQIVYRLRKRLWLKPTD